MQNHSLVKLNLFYALVIISLSLGTGVLSDDFGYLPLSSDSLFAPEDNYLNIPLAYLLQGSALILSSIDNYMLVEVFKAIYLLLSFYMIRVFLQIFLPVEKSHFFSFLFIFFPMHDGSTYWIMGQYLILSCACILYAYYWVINKRYGYAIAFVLIGSFLCYGSIAIIIPLCLILLIEKKIKEIAIIFLPNFIYSLYYMYATEVIGTRESRLQVGTSLTNTIKNLIIQCLTFFDSFIGLTFILKVFYSICALSLIMGLLALIVIYFYKSNFGNNIFEQEALPKKLLIFCISVTVCNLMMFTLTGRYPQLGFNLGNRVITYSCFLFIPLFSLRYVPEVFKKILTLILVLAIFGLSSHWKSWSSHQDQIIHNLKGHKETFSDQANIFVTYNHYSQLGPFSHLEFLSEHWVVNSIVQSTLGKQHSGYALTSKRFTITEEGLKDIKYNQTIPIKEFNNYIYDSSQNKILIKSKQELSVYIKSLPTNKRHWIQFIQNPSILQLLKKISPRLEYAL